LSNMNESCHIWVVSRMTRLESDAWSACIESCHICMSHVIDACVMSHITYDTLKEWQMHSLYWVMTHLDESHMNETCHVLVMSHMTRLESEWRMQHLSWVVSSMHASCHKWMNHVTSDTPREWVTQRLSWVVSNMNASCHKWMRHIWHA